MHTCGAVIVAAGSGRRMKSDKNKVFLEIDGIPVLARTLMVFQHCEKIGGIVVVTRKGDIEQVENIKKKYNINKLYAVTVGGEERMQSVLNGLEALGSKYEYIAIHDGARCLVEESDIINCINDAEKYGAAALGVPAKDSLKKTDESGFIECAIDRKNAVNIQTPQVFKYLQIVSLHRRAAEKHIFVTDDTSLLTDCGEKVFVTAGSYDNIKITTKDDLDLARLIIDRRKGVFTRKD